MTAAEKEKKGGEKGEEEKWKLLLPPFAAFVGAQQFQLLVCLSAAADKTDLLIFGPFYSPLSPPSLYLQSPQIDVTRIISLFIRKKAQRESEAFWGEGKKAILINEGGHAFSIRAVGEIKVRIAKCSSKIVVKTSGKQLHL